MSLLLRLLTTGKSLVGVRDEDNRYRLSTQRLLPKFGSGRNPFQRPADVESGPAATATANGAGAHPSGVEATAEPAQRPGPPLPAELPGKRPRAVAGKPFGTPAPLSSKGPGKEQEQSRHTGFRRFAGWFSPGTRPPNQPAGVSVKPPVQCELSLDRVQVVRNDLSDSDLEIVARQAVAPKSAVTARPAPKPLPQVPGRMARATTRLLSALKT
jgi:hypothetical protein